MSFAIYRGHLISIKILMGKRLEMGLVGGLGYENGGG